MEASSLPAALELVVGGGAGLSPEKRAVLGSSLLLLQRDYRFERVWFWGCIQGVRGTYYIAEGLGPDRAAPRSRLYSLNCVDWSLLPPVTAEMVAQTEQLKGRFQGDPSFEYKYTEIKEEDAERLVEDSEEPTIKEEVRLVATVEQIDKAVGIIPRGAFLKTPRGSVHENRNFEGLSLAEAKKLSSYFHFTVPVNLKNKTLLEKADLDPSTDFLDSLEHDIPQGLCPMILWPADPEATKVCMPEVQGWKLGIHPPTCPEDLKFYCFMVTAAKIIPEPHTGHQPFPIGSWTVQLEKGGTVVVLRSLLWLGLTFYHIPMTKQYGYIYFGTGEKNFDLPFML